MKKSTRRIILAALEGDETLAIDELRQLRQTVLSQRRPAPPAEPSLLLSQSEVAHLLGFSRFTVRRLADEGALPTVAIRGTRRYRRKDVERVIETGWPPRRDLLDPQHGGRV